MSRIHKMALVMLLAGAGLAPRAAYAFSEQRVTVDQNGGSNVADPDENFDQASGCFDGDKQACGNLPGLTGGNGWSFRTEVQQPNAFPMPPRNTP